MTIYATHAINAELMDDQLGQFTTAAIPLQEVLPTELTLRAITNANELIQAVYPSADFLAEAADLVLNGQDPSAAMARHAADFHIQPLVEAVRKRAKIHQAEAVNAAADTIIQTLRAQVFEPTVSRLEELAQEHGWGWDMNAAISAQDFARAAAIKEATELIVKLKQVDNLRRKLHPGAFDGPAAFATEANAFDMAKGTEMGSLTWWMQLIDAGATLHYPTLGEYDAIHNSAAHVEYREAQATEEDPWTP
ncbi:hypothetical protein [Pseudarthrobacter sp. BIM B-2242]|uniref:hypothetical protein n=1 Tax=Pseudarthrobacter sp. BIM B-2242 TaxID=2772401 RepID=UPI00168AB060|nr:hypothetical protein [Pseudarthrobacter sp. BIM B-2242]QOD04876.1 hypothetical protein IDT60_07640 [Pseudarthrobacter sp. BIM B-2242]